MTTFVDTNVLVYARDTSEPAKQPRAEAWMQHLWRTRAGRTSVQVLNEYYVTVTRKLSPGLDRSSARDDVRDLGAWRPAIVGDSTMTLAWDLEDRFSLSWWDSLVVASALELGCDDLLTEDLQDGHSFDGLIVKNPFLHAPE